VDANALRVDLDVVAAAEELRRAGAASVVLAGASLGGAAVLAAATEIAPPVQGVIALAAPSIYGPVDPTAAVERSRVPTLFVSAGGDPLVDVTRTFYTSSPAPDKRLLIAPGSEHGAPVLEDPGTRAAVDAWISAHSQQ